MRFTPKGLSVMSLQRAISLANFSGVERLLEKEKTLGAHIKFEDIAEEVGGVYPRIMEEGDMEAGAWSCGMVAGLVYDIPTVQELVDRIMQEADSLIAQRLSNFAAA